MTVRKHLVELLSQQPRSVSSLALELGMRRGDLEENVRHAIRSAEAAGHRVIIEPARCKTCGFVFSRERLARPGRCPACKGGRVFEAQIRLE